MEAGNISLGLNITDSYWIYNLGSAADNMTAHWVPGFEFAIGSTAREARSFVNQWWCPFDSDGSWFGGQSLATFDCADHDYYLPWV